MKMAAPWPNTDLRLVDKEEVQDLRFMYSYTDPISLRKDWSAISAG